METLSHTQDISNEFAFFLIMLLQFAFIGYGYIARNYTIFTKFILIQLLVNVLIISQQIQVFGWSVNTGTLWVVPVIFAGLLLYRYSTINQFMIQAAAILAASFVFLAEIIVLSDLQSSLFPSLKLTIALDTLSERAPQLAVSFINMVFTLGIIALSFQIFRPKYKFSSYKYVLFDFPLRITGVLIINAITFYTMQTLLHFKHSFEKIVQLLINGMIIKIIIVVLCVVPFYIVLITIRKLLKPLDDR